MKRMFMLMMLATLVLAPAVAGETLEKTFQVREGQQLSVDIKSGGSINVQGWDKKAVKVVVKFRNGDADEWEIEIKQTGGGVEVESGFVDHRGSRYDSPTFEFSVPRTFDLRLKSMGGSLTIDGVSGNIRGRTMGGALELNRLGGQLDLVTMGGKITLRDSDVDGSVKTMGGRVLLENVVGDIKGKSMGGNVVYKNVKPRRGESSGKVVKISTMGGSINVDEAPDGADVHTMGGKIRIKNAASFIKAKTMGGDIAIDAIDGWVEATTMGGDIEATMVGDPGKGERHVSLTSLGGDIILTVPAGLAMDISIRISVTRNSYGEYEVKGDFPLKARRDKDPENDRKYREIVTAGGVTGDGRHKVTIRTVNGNVTLLKAK